MSEAGAAAPSAPSGGGEANAAAQTDRAEPPSWMRGMGSKERAAPEANAADRPPPEANEEPDDAGPAREQTEGNEPPDARGGEKHKVKVNGEEVEVSLDELKSGWGRMKAATQKFQEASELSKEVDRREGVIKNFVEGLRTGSDQQVAALLQRLGRDPIAFAEKLLTHHLKLADMPAHERGMLELQQQREAFKREQETTQQQREQEATNAEAQQVLTNYVSEAQDAFKAHGVNASPTLMARAGAAMEHALTHGYEMTMKEAVGAVVEEVRELARTMGRDAFAQHVGDPAQADKLKREQAGKASQEQRRAAATAAQKPRNSNGQFTKPRLDPVTFGSFADAFAARAAREGRG